MRISILSLTTYISVGLSISASGDSWSSPPGEYWSENKRFVLKVKPWAKPLMLVLKEKSANGFKHIWTVKSPQAASPVEVYFASDGKTVVLRDEWHGVGYGKVLAFVSGGRVHKVYELKDLLSQEEIYSSSISISSIWWSSGARFFFREQQSQFAFLTKQGTLRVFHLPYGNQIEASQGLTDEIRGQQIELLRKDLSNPDTRTRGSAASQLGVLRDKESVPALVRLLKDGATSRMGMVGVSGVPTGTYTYYPVQLDAGSALVGILGKKAQPYLEPKLKGANAYMKRQWRELIHEAEDPKYAE